MPFKFLFYSFFILFLSSLQAQNIKLIGEIKGRISPKSIVYNGHGVFVAQNMMYRHSITFYNAQGHLDFTLSDEVNLSHFGHAKYQAKSYQGSPVEACFTEDGQTLWVSNYAMFGDGFQSEGCDTCVGTAYDPGFLYKINVVNHQIENVIQVGSVPKFLAIHDKSQTLAVSNWTSSTVSIVDLKTETVVREVKVGRHPRGLVYSEDGQTLYVAVMGSRYVIQLDLSSYEMERMEVGAAPRHLLIDHEKNCLYASLNYSAQLVKIDLKSQIKSYVKLNRTPRSMVFSADKSFVYVVNYAENTFQKVDVNQMRVVQTIATAHHPIGITANWDTNEIWVACYSGVIQRFKESNVPTVIMDDISENKKEEVKPIEVEKEVVDVVKMPIKRPLKANYYLIVGSFSIYQNAVHLRDELISKGYYLSSLLPSPNKNMTMVAVAYFSTESEANTKKNQILNQINMSGWVYKNPRLKD